MAVRTLDNVKAVVTGQIPPNFKASVLMRVKKAEFGPSKASQKPMITWTCEIIHPQEVVSDYDGKTYDLTGGEVPIYLSLSEVTASGKESDSLRYIIESLLPLLGYPAELDDENPLYHEEKNPKGHKFEGLQFECIIASEVRKEQRRKQDGSYVPILDADGKEITKGNQWQMVGIKNILRRVNIEVNRPF